MIPDYRFFAEWLETYISAPTCVETGFYDKYGRLTPAALICFPMYLIKNGVFDEDKALCDKCKNESHTGACPYYDPMGECAYLSPNAAACARDYGEGPLAVAEEGGKLSEIDVLKNELACVNRKIATNCTDCEHCDLVLPDDVVIGALNAGIAALREKAEREKGCEYCTKPVKATELFAFYKDFPNYGDDGQIKTCLRQSWDGRWQLHNESIGYNEDGTEFADAADNADILACPHCGRALTGGTDNA